METVMLIILLVRRSRRINLRAFASERWATMEAREAEDQHNDRGRPHIGVTPADAVSRKIVLRLLPFFVPRRTLPS